MIIADFLQISINLIFVATVIIAVLLLGIVLMQRPKQEGLGAAFGAALTDQAFGARTTDVLQKGTVYLGSLFMIITFVFSLLVVYQSSTQKSKLGEEQAPTVEAPAVTPENGGEKAEGTTTAPASETEKSADWVKTAEEADKSKPAEQPAPAPAPAAPTEGEKPAEKPSEAPQSAPAETPAA